MEIKNVGQLRKIIENLSDDYEIEMRVRRKLTDEEIIELHKKYGRIYPYPYETSYSELETEMEVVKRILTFATVSYVFLLL